VKLICRCIEKEQEHSQEGEETVSDYLKIVCHVCAGVCVSAYITCGRTCISAPT
jgi:hypothetical protein